MTTHTSNLFPGLQRSPRGVSSYRTGMLRTTVMPHSPSDIVLWPEPMDSGRVPDDSMPIVHTEPLDQTTDAVLSLLPLGQPERLAELEGQAASEVAVDVDLVQEHLPFPPVMRLPPEILAYVFELYLTHVESTRDGVGALSEVLICLTRVCNLWQAIAESTPRLWTSIHFYFPESHRSRKKDVPMVRHFLDLHLKHSGIFPISLTFADHRIYHSITEGLISLLVDRLRTHAPRWKRISLELPGAYFPLLFAFTPCGLSSLEYLCINGNMVVYAPPITHHLNLESATKLKSFAYSGPGHSVDDIIDFHWESLEEVSFEFSPHYGGSFASYRRFENLAQCQNITICSLGIDRSGSLNGSPAITLPYLHTLRVRRLSPYAHASGAIDPLILPRLQTLEIDASILAIRNQRWHDRTFSELLARSKCPLLHLSIQDVDFPNEEIIRCFAISRGLTSLRFIPCPRSQDISEVIERLDVSRNAMPDGTQPQGRRARRHRRPVVPQLREIALASSVEEYLDPMMAMFRSRVGSSASAAGVAALRRVEVIFFELWHDTSENRAHLSGDLSGRVTSFQEDLERLVCENRNEKGEEDEDKLEASMVVDSPYLPEYIDVR